jgi:hypothetical protein
MRMRDGERESAEERLTALVLSCEVGALLAAFLAFFSRFVAAFAPYASDEQVVQIAIENGRGKGDGQVDEKGGDGDEHTLPPPIFSRLLGSL